MSYSRYSKDRFYTLDIARALAIILVAIGHFGMKPMPEFYANFVIVIYMFHMPLFMFVSGFLVLPSMKKDAYWSFEKKKFYRLMIPYFVTSIIVITIKLLTERFLVVKNPVGLIDYIQILWQPSAGSFLWFVFALWWMMLIAPFFDTPRKRLLLLLVALPLNIYAYIFPEIFCLSKTASFLIYFAAGMVTYDFLSHISIKKLCLASFFAFPVLAALKLNNFLLFDEFIFLNSIITIVIAFTGIGFSAAISYGLEKFSSHSIKNILYGISAASYIIYLFHTTFMGFTKSFLVKMNFLSGDHFFMRYTLAELIVPIFSGIVIPIAFYYVIKRFKIARILFGLSNSSDKRAASRSNCIYK